MSPDISKINVVRKFLQGDPYPHGNGNFLDRRIFTFKGLHDFVTERRMKFILKEDGQLSFDHPTNVRGELLILLQEPLRINKFQWVRSLLSRAKRSLRFLAR